MKKPRKHHITRVTDMRLGIVHPTRDSRGHFVARKFVAKYVHSLSRMWPKMGPDVCRLVASDSRPVPYM